jgi:hypothetical protein
VVVTQNTTDTAFGWSVALAFVERGPASSPAAAY